MTARNRVTRRTVLAAGAGTAGAAGVVTTAGAVAAAAVGGSTVLTGCSASCDAWPEQYEPKRDTGTAADGRQVLAPLADIAVGHAVTAETAGGDPLLVVRATDGTAVAYRAKCTHHGCLVQPAGDRLHCPVHNATFDSATGAPTGGPPKRPLPRVEVEVVDGNVVLRG